MAIADSQGDGLERVADWLMEQALQDAGFEALFEGCCEQLVGAGIPLWRGHISFSVLHPQYRSMGMTWYRDQGLATETHPHRPTGEPFPDQFTLNPLFHLIETGQPTMRRRLTGEEAQLDFPVLEEFRDAGGTDYLAFIMRFGEAQLDGMTGSWATDRADGFSDTEIAALERIQQLLGVVCKMLVRDQIAQNVVATYLGGDAGHRVLAGQIQRGDVETIRAVIWYCDLRGSTEMADRLSPEAYIEALNGYFEATAGAVLAHGGDVLNFIGDAVLAIFPVGKEGATEAQACERALAASADASARFAALNEAREKDGKDAMRYGLALHVGDVLFGNTGVAERVTFSVIGPTVNEVARLESLTKELGRAVVVSELFAGNLPVEWERLGRHRLRGVGEEIEVLAPAQ